MLNYKYKLTYDTEVVIKNILVKSLLLTTLLFKSTNAMCELQNLKHTDRLIVYSKHHIFDVTPENEKKHIEDYDVTMIEDILSRNGTDVTDTDTIWSAVNKLTDTEVSSRMIEILNNNGKKIIDKFTEENNVNLKYYDNFNTALYSRYLLKRIIKKYEANNNTITEDDKTMFYKNIGRNLSQDDYNKMNLIIEQLVNIFCVEISDLKPLTIKIHNTLKFCNPGWRNIHDAFFIHYMFIKTFIMGYIDITRYNQDLANETLHEAFAAKVNNFKGLFPLLRQLGFEKYNTEYGYSYNYQHVTYRNFVIDNMQGSEKLYVQEFNKTKSFFTLKKLQKICNTIILTINELFKNKLTKSKFNEVKN